MRAGGTSSGDSIAERERLVRETAEAAQREAAQARKVARRTLAGLVAAMFCAVVAGGLAWQRRQVAERKAGYSKITLGVVSTTRSCKSTDQICFRQRPQYHPSRRRPLFLRTKSCHSESRMAATNPLVVVPLPHEVDWGKRA